MSPKLDYLLYGNVGGVTDPDEMKLTGERNGKFPRQLATTDYMIQDPRYLRTYANYFCKFIDAYKEQGINIDMVMYQNEAYSYTPYPGCAWTAEGTIIFNRDYLAPALKKAHPEVKLYLGTFNTNRQDHVEKFLRIRSCRIVFLEWVFNGKDEKFWQLSGSSIPTGVIFVPRVNVVGAVLTGNQVSILLN